MGNIPGWLDHLFPSQSLPFLSLVANIGLILYMFLVGLELNPTTLFKNGRWVGGWVDRERGSCDTPLAHPPTHPPTNTHTQPSKRW